MEDKDKIVKLFKDNVKGKKPVVKKANVKHDGKEGHWLERQFGISANGNNEADLLGYELKNQTTSKTTFGDWSPNRFIFKQGEYVKCFKGSKSAERQDGFCKIFGKPNENKISKDKKIFSKLQAGEFTSSHPTSHKHIICQ